MNNKAVANELRQMNSLFSVGATSTPDLLCTTVTVVRKPVWQRQLWVDIMLMLKVIAGRMRQGWLVRMQMIFSQPKGQWQVCPLYLSLSHQQQALTEGHLAFHPAHLALSSWSVQGFEGTKWRDWVRVSSAKVTLGCQTICQYLPERCIVLSDPNLKVVRQYKTAELKTLLWTE